MIAPRLCRKPALAGRARAAIRSDPAAELGRRALKLATAGFRIIPLVVPDAVDQK
eukprot:CAMPEP_0183771264 /NCGR_PEP_ID=MMETSP0739-20130205/31936_1 /TAXON_ID=385413 /ORGANISM="Thalassiosira miniscula, Strain CCMP1093" /LENGTH=54 /DNA_ID=CAMNT_0026011583 /DNA_START=182 /DNA_END=343 /DNA_ORIENTATION=-